MYIKTILPRMIYRNVQSIATRPPVYWRGRIVCSCGAEIDQQKIDRLFRERRLRDLVKSTDCQSLRRRAFRQPKNCELVDAITRSAFGTLKTFKDVLHFGGNNPVFLEALQGEPLGKLGNLTGDYGKSLVYFIEDCLDRGLLMDVGALFDIGGQNNATVIRVGEVLGLPSIPSFVIDTNLITPAINEAYPNVNYIIMDAEDFFVGEFQKSYVQEKIEEIPALYIFNNLVNVLRAEKGWGLLEAAWASLKEGDYLIVSGLNADELSAYGFSTGKELDGIVEFFHKGVFHKSALTHDFSGYVEKKLKGAVGTLQEDFSAPIVGLQGNEVLIEGRRIFTLKKQVQTCN